MTDKTADRQPPEEVETPAPAPPPAFEMSVTEFCASHSATDKRVEMLAAFYHDETVAGRTRGTRDAFAARLEAFATRPV